MKIFPAQPCKIAPRRQSPTNPTPPRQRPDEAQLLASASTTSRYTSNPKHICIRPTKHREHAPSFQTIRRLMTRHYCSGGNQISLHLTPPQCSMTRCPAGCTHHSSSFISGNSPPRHSNAFTEATPIPLALRLLSMPQIPSRRPCQRARHLP